MAFDINKAIVSQQMARPQKDYLWRVELPDVSLPSGESLGGLSDPSLLAGTSSLFGQESFFDMETLNYRVISAQVPFFEISTDNQSHQNSFWYYATTNDIGSITLEIEEHEDGQTYQYLNQWRSLIQNNNGTYNPPVMYKREIKYFKIANVKLDVSVHKYKGYFISNVSDLGNTYDSNGIMRYSVTLTGDDMDYRRFTANQAGITEKEQEILSSSIERGNLIDRFGGFDRARISGIFDRVAGEVFSRF